MAVDIEKLKTIAGWLGTGSINIFGVPFAGKDTQGSRLADFFKAPLIGGGDILRNTKNVPEHVLETINKGALAPTQDYLSLVTPYLSQKEFKNRPLILSSVGRWQGEETVILEAASRADHAIKAVILLNMPEEKVRNRWENLPNHMDRGGRVDDSDEIIKVRLEEFRTKTLPVIDFYRQKGLLIEVDGSLTPDEVTNLIIDALYQAAANSKH